ncbi:MAG: hypothetical protein ABIQ40_19040 [Bacteroidia bacterium]
MLKLEDYRKFKCNTGKCKAKLPEVYCERVMIMRREIPRFIELIDKIGDALLSYHILHPERGEKDNDPAMDKTWIFIWVDPRKHHDPEYLVKAGSNIACNSFTLEEEVAFTKENGYRDEMYRQTCREMNCPVCIKNHLSQTARVMTHEQYIKGLAASAGIHD